MRMLAMFAALEQVTTVAACGAHPSTWRAFP